MVNKPCMNASQVRTLIPVATTGQRWQVTCIYGYTVHGPSVLRIVLTSMMPVASPVLAQKQPAKLQMHINRNNYGFLHHKTRTSRDLSSQISHLSFNPRWTSMRAFITRKSWVLLSRLGWNVASRACCAVTCKSFALPSVVFSAS